MKYIIEVADDAAEDMKYLVETTNTVWIKDWCQTVVTVQDIQLYNPPRDMPGQATPSDTFDHLFGSGATRYSWWWEEDATVQNEDGAIKDWSVKLVGEDGYGDDGASKERTITHADVIEAARSFLENKPKFVGPDFFEQCAYLLYASYNMDMDANIADSFLQLMVFGEIVFG